MGQHCAQEIPARYACCVFDRVEAHISFGERVGSEPVKMEMSAKHHMVMMKIGPMVPQSSASVRGFAHVGSAL
jgi:hypothetical protein